MLRAQRGVAGARAAGRGARRDGAPGARARRRAGGCGSTTGACSRPTWSCGPAGRGSGVCSPTSCPSRSTCQELFFLDGGPAWRTPGVPAFVDFEARDLRHGRPRRPRRQGRARPRRAAARPRRAAAAASAAGEARAREFLRERFPALAQAPLAASKSCRYELSTDSHFVATRHPEHPSVWLLGGGSGHGFKHGPAMAERMAAALAGDGRAAGALRPRPPRPGRSLRTAGAIARE